MREHARGRRTFVFSRVAGLLALVVLLPALAGAQQWTHATSDHFEVYTTGGVRRARAALTYFERVHAFLEDVLNLSPVQQPTRLIVFSSARETRRTGSMSSPRLSTSPAPIAITS